MILRRNVAPPHAHHLELAVAIAGDVRRHLDRLGRMRSLAVVALGGNGAYRINLLPASEVTLPSLERYGVGSMAAIEIIDDVLDYDAEIEAAVLIVETNPIDEALLTFLVQSFA